MPSAITVLNADNEVDVRRAISAAYSALFHTLARTGAKLFEQAGPLITKEVIRSFEHGMMARTCKNYLKPEIRRTTDFRIIAVATAFIELQEARVVADYDLFSEFNPDDAFRLVSNGAAALISWADINQSEQAIGFLAKLLLGTRLGKRG